MNENLSDVLKREMDILSQEKEKDSVSNNIKKMAFAEEIKSEFGKKIKDSINNPDRHNHKKMSFWKKLKKSLGC